LRELGEEVRAGEGESIVERVTAIVSALERAPGVVVPLVRDVPEGIVKRRPAPAKWSAHEHACHLSVVHRLFFDRLDQMLAVPAPVITPYDPSTDPGGLLQEMNLEDALQTYTEDRRRLVARLQTLSADDWSRTAEHGEYNQYSVLIMFRHLALHDFFHAYRIEELLLKKDWPSSSPR
jgi:DinB superfamily